MCPGNYESGLSDVRFGIFQISSTFAITYAYVISEETRIYLVILAIHFRRLKLQELSLYYKPASVFTFLCTFI